MLAFSKSGMESIFFLAAAQLVVVPGMLQKIHTSALTTILQTLTCAIFPSYLSASH